METQDGGTRPRARLKNAAKALGCAVLALIVLAIALVAGVFDLLF